MADNPKPEQVPDMDVNLDQVALDRQTYIGKLADREKKLAAIEAAIDKAKQAMYQDWGGLLGGGLAGLWNVAKRYIVKREALPEKPESLKAYERRLQRAAADRKAAGRSVDPRATSTRPVKNLKPGGAKPATAES